MKLKAAHAFAPIQWLPAERLGQLSVDPNLRPWLIGKGLLSVRLKEACGERYGLRLADLSTDLLTSSHRSALRTRDEAGLFRDVQISSGDQVCVFAQAVAPDSTLTLHPWLAELGDTALDQTLQVLSGVERSSYEYAWLPAHAVSLGGDPLAARALGGAEIKPAGLWARRARVALRGAPLLMQEVFLPALGRC